MHATDEIKPRQIKADKPFCWQSKSAMKTIADIFDATRNTASARSVYVALSEIESDERGESFTRTIAVHVGPIPGFTIEGVNQVQTEHAFGIDAEGNEQTEAQLLTDFRTLMSDFDIECDEIVGHNIIGFDLPFVFQRCMVQNIGMRPFVNLGDYNVRGVFDTMRVWCARCQSTTFHSHLSLALAS
jgi:hypothetical protein